jgi:uncharacterized Tic20 family protein
MERLDQPILTGDDRTFSMLAHLSAILGFFFPFGSIIGPLIAWSAKRDTSEFVDENGKAAVNFHITWTLIIAALWILWLIQFFGSFPLMMLLEGDVDMENNFPVKLLLSSFLYLIPIGILYLFKFIMILVGTITASGGRIYRYPLTYRFIK